MKTVKISTITFQLNNITKTFFNLKCIISVLKQASELSVPIPVRKSDLTTSGSHLYPPGGVCGDACPTARSGDIWSGGLSLRAGLAAGEDPLGSGVGLARSCCSSDESADPGKACRCLRLRRSTAPLSIFTRYERGSLHWPTTVAGVFHPLSPSILTLTSWP